jgi:type IV pilus assembly protein PilE
MIRKSAGFTLIELIIAVTIIAILAGIAYPVYIDYVRKTNRAEAKVELMDAAQRLQRCYTALGKFNDSANCPVYSQILSNIVTRKGYYRIYIASAVPATATTYTLHAEAVKKPQTEDTKNGCNNLSIDQNGNMLPVICW